MPTSLEELLALGDEPYILLTTFRRTGVPVSTAVWVGRDTDSLLVTSMGLAGKVKRLRNDDRVELTPCDIRGQVTDGAVTLSAHATIHPDADTMNQLADIFVVKYGDRYREIRAAAAERPPGRESVALRIRP